MIQKVGLNFGGFRVERPTGHLRGEKQSVASDN